MQQQTTQAEVKAAQARVTPHELAQATALVEARREAEAKNLADTIALGEAVQQLGLAATPEELFAEVQALRANAPQNNTEVEAMSAALDQKERKRQMAWLVGFSICSLLLVGGILIPLSNNMGSTAHSSSYTTMQTPTFTAERIQSLHSTPVPTTASVNANQVRKLNPGLFQSLDLKEGQSAHCSMAEIQSLARGANPAQIWVTKKAGELTWHLTRRSGKFCIQCYTTSAEAAKLANGQAANVGINQPDDSTVSITLPLEKFTNADPTETQGDVVTRVQMNGR